MAEDKNFGKATNTVANALDSSIEGIQKAAPVVKRGALDALNKVTVDPDKLGENIRGGFKEVSKWLTPKKPVTEDKP